MSVNVDFKISVSGFGADKAAVERVSELLADEGLLGQLVEKVGRGQVVFASDYPIIISKSYKYLPELQNRLAKVAKGGVAIEFKTRTEGAPWKVVSLGTKSTKTAKAAVARGRAARRSSASTARPSR